MPANAVVRRLLGRLGFLRLRLVSEQLLQFVDLLFKFSDPRSLLPVSRLALPESFFQFGNRPTGKAVQFPICHKDQFSKWTNTFTPEDVLAIHFDTVNPADWNGKARQSVRQRKLGYYESLDGFPSLDLGEDLSFPALTNTDGGTIASQASQSYMQWVPMHDPDQALSLLPIGQSERPDHRWRTSTFDLWAEGRLHPAPLSPAKVKSLADSRQTLGTNDSLP